MTLDHITEEFALTVLRAAIDRDDRMLSGKDLKEIVLGAVQVCVDADRAVKNREASEAVTSVPTSQKSERPDLELLKISGLVQPVRQIGRVVISPARSLSFEFPNTCDLRAEGSPIVELIRTFAESCSRFETELASLDPGVQWLVVAR